MTISGIYRSKKYLENLRITADATVGIESLRGKSVLVAGASGLIGSFLVDVLGELGIGQGLGVHVVATGRSLSRLESRFSGSPYREGIELAALDVCEAPTLGCHADIIVHAASNADPSSMTSDPVGTIMSNVTGTHNLLEWGRTHGCSRFLYVSSGEVYGQADASTSPYVESLQGYVDPLAMRSCYPLAKRMAENLCVCWQRKFGGECVIVRPSHTYGPCATDRDSRANEQFVRAALAGGDIVLRSRGTQVRSYNYVADAVSGLLSVLARGRPGHAYNLASPDAHASIAEFAEVVSRMTGVCVTYDVPEVRGADETPIERQVLDVGELLRLGWSPCFSLERGIADTLEIRRDMARM